MKTFKLKEQLSLAIIFFAGINIWGQTQNELLKHWAPEVYQDVNSSKSPGIIGNRQYYTARDIPVAVDFDEDWTTGNNWDNSHYQVWEQGKLTDRLTPELFPVAYTSFVETMKFYFLGYGFYHAGDDSNVASDRHENDWEMVMLCIKKDGTEFGSFQGMVTQFHRDHKKYDKNYAKWNGSHPKIYISANGTFDPTSPYEHGHGIEEFTNTGYQDDFGTDAIILQASESSKNIKDVSVGDEDWNTVQTHTYKLISINQLWNCRNNSSVYNTYTKFQGGINGLQDGGNPPWDKGYFSDPLNATNISDEKLVSPFADDDKFSYLHEDIEDDFYFYNPYYLNESGQQLNENPRAIVRKNKKWSQANIGKGDGKMYYHRKTFIVDGRGNAFGGERDNGFFVYKNFEGDIEIIATVDQLQRISGSSKAGLMIRESLSPGSKCAFLKVSPDMVVKPQFRKEDGGNTSYFKTAELKSNAPVFLKLVRKGDTFSMYYSTNGEAYTFAKSATINMDETVYVGMAVCSGVSDYFSSAALYNVSVNGNEVPEPIDAIFSTDDRTVTEGEVVEFKDLSKGEPTAWSWEFEGGTPSSSTEQHPSITYKKEGTYQVKLTVSNAKESDTEVKTGYIKVIPGIELIPGHIYTIKNVSSGKYIDVDGFSQDNHANIHQWKNTGADNQRWLVQEENGLYTFKALHSNKCMDVEREGKHDGANIQQYDCNGKNNQKWEVTRLEEGNYKIASVNSGKVLDVDIATCGSEDGCNLHQWRWHGRDNQRWVFTEAAPDAEVISGNVYQIKNAETGRFLHVDGASQDNQARVFQWENTGGDNQKWLVEKENGVYTMKVEHSGKCADVKSESKDKGAVIQQYDCNGKNNQKWRFIYLGNKQFRIESVHSGKVLDVDIAKCGQENGCTVHQWNWHGRDNQRWMFVDTEKGFKGAEGVPSSELKEPASFMVYPNPAGEFVYVKSDSDSHSVLSVYNLQGRLTYTETFMGNTAVNTSQMNGDGIFIFKLTTGSKTENFLITIE